MHFPASSYPNKCSSPNCNILLHLLVDNTIFQTRSSLQMILDYYFLYPNFLYSAFVFYLGSANVSYLLKVNYLILFSLFETEFMSISLEERTTIFLYSCITFYLFPDLSCDTLTFVTLLIPWI